ncbi:MAG TPA: hypothetical protein VMW29_03750 [Candidatus Bathyarchaeia archaeon]|nr:hypothetical protein [Candidatus Bathyarchaeia archaeon]
MCSFYSPIIDRKLKLYDCVEIDDSHETVVEKFKLNDNKLKNRDIVRLEINPLDWNKLKARFNQKDWNYQVDEEGTLPEWYTKNEKKIIQLVFRRLKQLYKKMFVFSGKHTVRSGRLFAYGSSQVKAYGSSQVEAWSSSQVEANGSSQVEANGSSQVKAWSSSQVKAYGSSQVEANGSSNIIAYSFKKIELKDNSACIDRRQEKPKFYKAEKVLRN